VELPDDVFFGHDHAAHVSLRVQSPLIDLANLGILGHHQIGEIDTLRISNAGLAKLCGENKYSTRSSVAPARGAASAPRARSRCGRR
jgi:hypothetical protein